jgi:hypothetical protein
MAIDLGPTGISYIPTIISNPVGLDVIPVGLQPMGINWIPVVKRRNFSLQLEGHQTIRCAPDYPVGALNSDKKQPSARKSTRLSGGVYSGGQRTQQLRVFRRQQQQRSPATQNDYMSEALFIVWCTTRQPTFTTLLQRLFEWLGAINTPTSTLKTQERHQSDIHQVQ